MKDAYRRSTDGRKDQNLHTFKKEKKQLLSFFQNTVVYPFNLVNSESEII